MFQRHKGIRLVLQKGPQLLGEEGNRKPLMVCGRAQKRMRLTSVLTTRLRREGPSFGMKGS